MGLSITLYLSYVLKFPNNILLKKDSVSKNIFENQYTQVYLCDFHISRPNCISHIFAIVDRIGSLRGWISAASVHYSGNTQQEKTIGSRGIVHDTLRQQCPQEESGHYNYGLPYTLLHSSFRKFSGCREMLIGGGGSLCMYEMGGEKQDGNAWSLRDIDNRS